MSDGWQVGFGIWLPAGVGNHRANETVELLLGKQLLHCKVHPIAPIVVGDCRDVDHDPAHFGGIYLVARSDIGTPASAPNRPE